MLRFERKKESRFTFSRCARGTARNSNDIFDVTSNIVTQYSKDEKARDALRGGA